VLYRANNQDVQSFVAMLMSFTVPMMCCGAGYCLPFVALILGVMALINAKDAVDPARSRQQAWISLVVGGGTVVLFIGCMVLYFGAIFAPLAGFNSLNNQPFVFPTFTSSPAPTIFPSASPRPPRNEPTFEATEGAAVPSPSPIGPLPTAFPELGP